MHNSFWLFGTEVTVLADQAAPDGHYDLLDATFNPDFE